MFNVGDRVKLGWFYDTCSCNYQLGTISYLREYNFYPNRDYSVIQRKLQGTVVCDNGFEIDIPDFIGEFQGKKYVEKIL